MEDEGCFAGAVRSEQDEGFARVQLEIDAAERFRAVVVVVSQIAGFY
jgi:hypothetical protein